MIVAARRLFLLTLLAGAACAGWSLLRRRTQPVTATPAPRPTASKADDVPLAFTQLTDDLAVAPGASTPLWLAPVDGACPAGYPIKANANSGIYHVPGGRFYERTIPERCYADTADAEADGYRRAKA
jgi:hypothetical protein